MRQILPFLRNSIVILILLLAASAANAQLCPTGTCADLNNPQSANWYISQLYLGDANGNPLSESSLCTVTEVYLFAQSGGSSTNAYTLKVYYEMYVGDILEETVDKCLHTGQKIPQLINLGLIEWDCNKKIELKNVYLSWQTNSNAACGCRNNSCNFAALYSVYTPVDNDPPLLNCPTTNLTVNTDLNLCTSSQTYTATASDNSGTVDVVYSIDGSPIVFPYDFPIGTTTVNVVATDPSNNTASCSFIVNVVDNQPPSITCPAPVSAFIDAGYCDATGITLGTPSTSDNCSGVISLSNDAPSEYPLGSTQVTWTATDAAGNTATCAQTVTVTDNQPPVVNCPGNIEVNAQSQIGAIVNFSATANDLCGNATLSYSQNPGTVFPIGTTTVTVTATDEANNTATCSFTVTVKDIDCIEIGACGNSYVVELLPQRVRTTTVYRGYLNTQEIINTISSNCGVPVANLNIVFSKTIFTPTDWGNQNLVTIWVSAPNQDPVSCTFNVIVRYPLKSGDLFAMSDGFDITGNLDLGLQIFPNPTAGKLKVELYNLNDPRVSAVVYNTSGAVVFHRELTTEGQIEIDLTGHVSGLYLLRIVADKREFLEKIILQAK
jgi:hypothetical protein